jgi:hypothetical protein
MSEQLLPAVSQMLCVPPLLATCMVYVVDDMYGAPDAHSDM